MQKKNDSKKLPQKNMQKKNDRKIHLKKKGKNVPRDKNFVAIHLDIVDLVY